MVTTSTAHWSFLSLKDDKCLWFSQYWEIAHFWPEVSIFFRCAHVMEYLWQCSKLAHPSSLIFCVWQEHVKSIFLSALQAPDLEYSPFFNPLLPWLIHLMSSTLNLSELADKSIRGQWRTVPGQARSLSYDTLTVLCATEVFRFLFTRAHQFELWSRFPIPKLINWMQAWKEKCQPACD